MNFLCGRLFKRRKLKLNQLDNINDIDDSMGSQFLDNDYMPNDDSNSETCSVDNSMVHSVQAQHIFPFNELEIQDQWELDQNMNTQDIIIQLSFDTFIEGAIKLQGEVSQVNLYNHFIITILNYKLFSAS
jgi:hypothetical protein